MEEEYLSVKNVIGVYILPIFSVGRSKRITVTDICKLLNLNENDGFKVAVLKNGLVIMQPIKNVKNYLEKVKQWKDSKVDNIPRKVTDISIFDEDFI